MKNEMTEKYVLPRMGDFVRTIEALEDELETMSPRNAALTLNSIDKLSDLCREFRRMHTVDEDSVSPRPLNWLTEIYVQRAIRQLDNLNGHEACYVPDNVIEFLEKYRS